MQPDCTCPLCGSIVPDLPVAVLPERGMVVGNNCFVVMPAGEMVLLQRLIDVFPRLLSKESAMEWMYQLNPDKEPEIKIVDVLICKIRKKLEPLGIRIDTVWGKGYVLAMSAKPRVIREEAA